MAEEVYSADSAPLPFNFSLILFLHEVKLVVHEPVSNPHLHEPPEQLLTYNNLVVDYPAKLLPGPPRRLGYQ